MAADDFPAIDLESLDFSQPIAEREGIEKHIPHRHEMVLLSGILSVDSDRRIIVGYLDLKDTDFWVRGHFPNFAVMPGVLMCEAAAQLTSFYMYHQGIVPPDRIVALGGIESARFREPVQPPQRLVLVGVARRTGLRLTKFEVCGFIKKDGKYDVAFETEILGVALGKTEDMKRA